MLIPTPAIRNLIRDDKVHQIYSTMQTGQEKFGMQTMNQSLATLYQKRLITLDTAMAASSLKDELEQMISRGAGVVPGAGMARPGAGLPPRARRDRRDDGDVRRATRDVNVRRAMAAVRQHRHRQLATAMRRC